LQGRAAASCRQTAPRLAASCCRTVAAPLAMIPNGVKPEMVMKLLGLRGYR